MTNKPVADSTSKKWWKRIFFFSFLGILFAYVLALLSPFLQPDTWWFVAIFGLAFPYLFLLLLICLLTWIVKRNKKWIIVVTVFLLLGGWQLGKIVGLHPGSSSSEPSTTTVRVMNWNVSRWDEQNREARGGTSYRNLMLDAVAAQAADVLCFQEFFEPYYANTYESNLDALKTMGYPYTYYFPSSIIYGGNFTFGLAIASRYPIVDTGHVNFGLTPHSEGVIYTDINVHGQRIRIFSTHLESARLSNYGYFGGRDQASLQGAKSALHSIKHAYQFRLGQSELLVDELKRSPYPVILAGNLGDVPNSFVAGKIRGSRGLQDAFLKKGFGLGSSFRFFLPTLRIDYILADPTMKVSGYECPDLIYSDHYPVIANIEIRLK